MGVQHYRLHDSIPGSGMVRVNLDEASHWNMQGFGIFHTINEFNGPRQIKNLTKILCWAIDLDMGTKESMLEKLSSGLPPSMLIETRRGYHAYWRAKEAEPKHWNSIVLDRLVPFYGADTKARDMARVLRTPGFFHMKNPAEPFLIQKVWEYKTQYSEQDMAFFYPDESEEKREVFRKVFSSETKTIDLWEAVWRMDCMNALERLSGTDAVGGEIFSFRKNNSETWNIFVNGKGTSCWIDRDGRIGSLDGGGPTIFQWINYYHRNKSKTVQIMKEVFKELPWIR